MHLLALSLLTILAGTLLLAKFRKEMPGKFFAFISWFFIVVGFVIFIGFIGGGICKMTNSDCCSESCCKTEVMMKDCQHGMKSHACCPQGTKKEMCAQKPGCKSDSLRKVCPKKAACDSTKMQIKEE